MAEQIKGSIVVRSSVEDVFLYWVNFENFPDFMGNIKSVQITGDQTSHWVMQGPMGMDIEWDAIITDIEPNRRIAWASTGGDINTNGEVVFHRFSPEETEVEVTLMYEAPGGRAGEMLAKAIDNPQDRLAQDLRNFKQHVESVYNPLPRY